LETALNAVTNTLIEEEPEESQTPPKPPSTENEGMPEAAPAPSPVVGRLLYGDELKQLLFMGYKEEDVAPVLAKHKGDIEKTLDAGTASSDIDPRPEKILEDSTEKPQFKKRPKKKINVHEQKKPQTVSSEMEVLNNKFDMLTGKGPNNPKNNFPSQGAGSDSEEVAGRLYTEAELRQSEQFGLLVSMGFAEQVVLRALGKHCRSFEKAIEILTDETEASEVSESSSPPPSMNQQSSSSSRLHMAAIGNLTNMGFSEDQARRALTQHDGNFELALDMLLSAS